VIDSPQIVQTPAQATAVIHLTIPRADMPKVMGPGIAELMGALAAQGITPAGAIFAHHFQITPESFDFELGVPVSRTVQPVGRVRPGQLPATTVARTIYHGGYEGLGAAWGEFDAWIKAQGRAPAANLWECYVQGPESGPDPARWRTELNRPLAR
jgi:effector-binding domain-containing protein